jgi:hypothetical protein
VQGFGLDADRVSQLRVFSDAERRAIARGAASAISGQLERLERALESSDLGTVADAAHHARNETLLVGAQPLTEALAEVERAARGGEQDLARGAAQQATAIWPATRAAIDEIAAEG